MSERFFQNMASKLTTRAGHSSRIRVGNGTTRCKHPRTVGKRNHARREGIVAGDAHEEIHELHRRRRGRKIPARNPPRDDDGGFFPRLRKLSGSRRADDAGTCFCFGGGFGFTSRVLRFRLLSAIDACLAIL
jgi:hypothetical protein